MSTIEQLNNFLKLLGRSGKYQYFWTIDKDTNTKRTYWYQTGESLPIVDTNRNHVYFGVHPTKEKKDEYNRSKNEDVSAINCLYAEFDKKDGNTIGTINNLYPMPSVVISSGGGWHCYWLLNNSIQVTEENIKYLAEIQERWVHFIGSDEGAKDLARVLRVPGTLNHKYKPALPVEFVEVNLERTYLLEDLISLLPIAQFKAESYQYPSHISSGERHNDLFKIASSLRGKGLTVDEIRATLYSIRESRVEERIGDSISDDEIENIIGSVAKYEQGTLEKYNLTDLGNAKRLVELHGDKIRFCEKNWYIWNGKQWKIDETSKIFSLVEDVIRLLYKEASEAKDSEDRKILANHAKNSESANSARNLLFWAETMVTITRDDFDKDKELLNVNNGILNLRTGELAPHDSKYMMSKIISFDYVKNSACPKWLKFLNYTIKDRDTIFWVQKALGISLSGRVEKILPLMYGKPDTGKSTFSETLLRIFGDYGQKTNLDAFSVSDFGNKGGDTANSRVRNLKGARFVVANETKEGQKLDVALMKDLSGGDTLNARTQYKTAETFKPTHTFWVYGNHKPDLGGVDEAIYSRVCIIDFIGVFTPEMKRPIDEVMSGFLEEAPGILNWVVEGYQLWLTQGIAKTKAIEAATNQYRDEEDIFKQFIEEEMEIEKDALILKDDLIRCFGEYCYRNGERKATLSKAKITRRLKDMGIEDFGKGRKYFKGIRFVLVENLTIADNKTEVNIEALFVQ